MTGKTIKIFLLNGEPSSIRIGEIINWTGKAIVFPRIEWKKLASRDELKQTGIYILVGDDEKSFKNTIYIGESDNIFNRLNQHIKDEKKDFWNQTIVFISKDDNLTKSHVLYLESQLLKKLQYSHRCTLKNEQTPENKSLPESDIADMNFFLDQIEILLPVMGFTFALPIPQDKNESSVEESELTFVYETKNIRAKLKNINGQLVVLKGSQATTQKQGSLYKKNKSIRDQLIEDGILKKLDQDDIYVFSENVTFNSVSAAASVIAASSVNGRQAWKHEKTGQSYGDWEQLDVESDNLDKQTNNTNNTSVNDDKQEKNNLENDEN